MQAVERVGTVRTHVEFKGSHADARRGPGPGQTDEVSTADVTREQRRADLKRRKLKR